MRERRQQNPEEDSEEENEPGAMRIVPGKKYGINKPPGLGSQTFPNRVPPNDNESDKDNNFPLTLTDRLSNLSPHRRIF